MESVSHRLIFPSQKWLHNNAERADANVASVFLFYFLEQLVRRLSRPLCIGAFQMPNASLCTPLLHFN